MSRVDLSTKTVRFSRERVVDLLVDHDLDLLIARLQAVREDEAQYAASQTLDWQLLFTTLYPDYDSGQRDCSRDEDPTSTLTITFEYERPATNDELAQAQAKVDAAEIAKRERELKSLRLQLQIAESSAKNLKKIRQQLRALGDEV